MPASPSLPVPPSPAEAPTTSLLTGLDALEALAPAWDALWRRLDTTPFQHPAWLLPWARTHAQDRVAAVVQLAGDELVAVLPIFTWEGGAYLAGAGPSDYGGELISDGVDVHLLLTLAAAHAERNGCDRLELPQLRPGSPLLDAAPPVGWTSEMEPGVVCPVAPLLGPEGLDGVPAHWRRKLAYAHRKVARAGAYVVQQADANTLEEIWGALEAAHAARWAARGEAGGVLADDLLLRFLQEAAPALLSAGLLRLYGLRLDGRVVAGLFAMQDGRRVHGYLTGFNPALGNLGLGSILIGHTMTEAAREGLTEMHFLRGQEPYKYTWGAADAPTWTRCLTRAD